MKPNERLIAARVAAGFETTIAASRAFGWPQRTYLRHEIGESGFNHVAEKYAAAFNVTVKDLLGDEPATRPNRWQPKSLNELPLIDRSDINALTEIARGLSPLASNTESPLAYGPRTFLMMNYQGSLLPQQTILAFDPDAQAKKNDLVLTYWEGEILPVLQWFNQDMAGEFHAKLVFAILSVS